MPSNTLATPPPPTRDVVRYPGSLHGGRGVRPNDASSRCTERSIPTQKFHIDDTSNPPPPVGKPPHGLGLCFWMHLVNGTGNSP